MPVDFPRNREMLGIGIDLVSWGRIERFLASHSPEFLERLLTPAEQSLFRASSRPVAFFARSFAAKEAFFKARGGVLLREVDFQETEVMMEGENGFRFPRNDIRTEGEFFETPDGVGARVVVWQVGSHCETAFQSDAEAISGRRLLRLAKRGSQ